MEAARIVWEMSGEDHRESFIVVGGGATIRTQDADLAVTGDA